MPESLDAFVAQLDAAGEQGHVRLLVDRYDGAVRDDDSAWLEEFTAVMARASIGLTVMRSALSDLAWRAREAGIGVDEFTLPRDASASLAQAVFVGQWLRFDYKFESLLSRARTWQQLFPGDALIAALAGYASFGLRRPDARQHIEVALRSDNADWRSRHVCLHAAWFATERDEFAELVLGISNDMLSRGEANSNVYYRRAGALRRLERYDQAQEEIDRALEMLTPGNNDVHQDYVRERELIVTSRDLAHSVVGLRTTLGQEASEAIADQVRRVSDALEAKVAEANRALSDGLLKIVEILGLFITIVGFLFGIGFAAVKAKTFWEAVAAAAVFVVGSVVFFMLLRFVVRFRR